MADCIFCNVRETGREYFIHEDDNVFVIPDKFPSARGHSLVISKEHVKNMTEASDQKISQMFSVAKRLALVQEERLSPAATKVSTYIGEEAGQTIFHFHVHVVPVYSKETTGFVRHKELSKEESIGMARILKF